MEKKKVKIAVGDLWRGKKDAIFMSKDDVVLVTDIKSNIHNVIFHYIDEPDEDYEWTIEVFYDSFKKIS